MHDQSCFVTLTYDNENLPINDFLVATLDKTDHQKFIKRLRKKYPKNKIKYFLAGEYGTQTQRPHYHAIIFGWMPNPDNLIKRYGYLFDKELESIWGMGNVQVADCQPKSIYYTTGYILKANLNREAILAREREYNAASQGLGLEWAKENADRIYELDMTANGKPGPIPRYYKKNLKVNKIKILDQTLQKEAAIARATLKTSIAKLSDDLYLKLKKTIDKSRQLNDAELATKQKLQAKRSKL